MLLTDAGGRGQEDGKWRQIIWRLEPFPHVCLAGDSQPQPPAAPKLDIPEEPSPPKSAKVQKGTKGGNVGNGGKGAAAATPPTSATAATPSSDSKGKERSGAASRPKSAQAIQPAAVLPEDAERELRYGPVWLPPSAEYLKTSEMSLTLLLETLGDEECGGCFQDAPGHTDELYNLLLLRPFSFDAAHWHERAPLAPVVA